LQAVGDLFQGLRRDHSTSASHPFERDQPHGLAHGETSSFQSTSQGKGAQIAGMDRRSFILALGRAGVDAIQVSAQELEAEVESELEARRQRGADYLP